ncbi:MAG: 50S ribosomal protein L25, partial [Prevotella sp.]|nr:50S ribosomal protein L25 [Prevotella sp.]
FEGLELATSKAVVVCSIKMTRNAQLAAQQADDDAAAE